MKSKGTLAVPSSAVCFWAALILIGILPTAVAEDPDKAIDRSPLLKTLSKFVDAQASEDSSSSDGVIRIS